jgi:predicted transcriptional regulator
MVKSLIVQLDDPTYRALTRIAQVSKRQRAEFVRSAIRKAIRETEEDSETAADDWTSAEKWKS